MVAALESSPSILGMVAGERKKTLRDAKVRKRCATRNAKKEKRREEKEKEKEKNKEKEKEKGRRAQATGAKSN